MPDFEPHIVVEDTAQKHNVTFVDVGGRKLFAIKNDKGEITGYCAYVQLFHTIHVGMKKNESGTTVLPDQGDFDSAVQAFKDGFFGSMTDGPKV